MLPLLRAGFGGTPAEVRDLANLGLEGAVDRLVRFTDAPPLPDDAAPDTPIGSIEIDSRKLRPGGLFVALPGDLSDRFRVSSTSVRDGHDYVAAAAAAGAAAAIPVAARIEKTTGPRLGEQTGLGVEAATDAITLSLKVNMS